jgi:hypothetical protein
MALSPDYVKKLRYLQDLSRKGTLNNNNSVYIELSGKAKNLPELRKALDDLTVNYV